MSFWRSSPPCALEAARKEELFQLERERQQLVTADLRGEHKDTVMEALRWIGLGDDAMATISEKWDRKRAEAEQERHEVATSSSRSSLEADVPMDGSQPGPPQPSAQPPASVDSSSASDADSPADHLPYIKRAAESALGTSLSDFQAENLAYQLWGSAMGARRPARVGPYTKPQEQEEPEEQECT